MPPERNLQEKPSEGSPGLDPAADQLDSARTGRLSANEREKMNPSKAAGVPSVTFKFPGPDGKTFDGMDDKQWDNATLYWNTNPDGSRTGMTRFKEPNSAGETIELHWHWDQSGQHPTHAMKITTDKSTGDTVHQRVGSHNWTTLSNNITGGCPFFS